MSNDMEKAIARLNKPSNVAWLCNLDIQTLPPIPQHITKLIIENCPKIVDINLSMNNRLNDICINYAHSLKTVILPSSITFIQLWECREVEQLVYQADSYLLDLILVGVPKLRYLPPFPPKIWNVTLKKTGLCVMPKPINGSYGMTSFSVEDNLWLPDLPRDLETKKFWEQFWKNIYRMKDLKEDIVAEAWNPRRVTAWLDNGISLDSLENL